ncbi:MAG: FecR domain-containing protein [Ignavibacteria bacterium]|nr:FecR domain-containing protein [Ignavibacteria bacterium]
MKFNKSIKLFVFSIALFTLFLSKGFSTESNKSTAAIVTKVIQIVEHKSGDSEWAATKPLTQLETSDVLRTGEKSLAIVRFLDGSNLRIREKTTITIYADKKPNGLSKNTRIDAGKMRFETVKQKEDDEFLITTPTAVASIRGTEGLVHILDNGATLLTLDSGRVDVRASVGARQSGTVEGGMTALISTEGNVSIDFSTPEQIDNSRQSTMTKEKYIIIQTNVGTFRLKYLDHE